ncbi:MAG: SDR family oxidoreductase [Candidatus Obscuribacterales bacterium]|nr:SDR family oxidoreductase [Candidatus Obscuribacterales bacterium]
MRFQGKVAVISGAGSGIGKACALRLAQEGCRIAALDINSDSIPELKKELSAYSRDFFCREGDISKAESVNSFVLETVKQFGRIDFLFNNAGVEFISALEETSEEDWEHVQGTNMKGTFLMSKAVLPYMKAQGGGVIVNNASDAGLRGIRLNAAYSSSKAGIIHLTRSMALDYGKYNIRCNCICPGCIKTPLCQRFNAEVGALEGKTGEEVLNEFVKANIPMQRVGMPEEVAAVLAFLCSDDARYISGAIIPVDGGLTAGM